jgi:feruloyl esterase
MERSHATNEAEWKCGRYGPFVGHFVYSEDWLLKDWRNNINFSTVNDHSKEVLSPVTAAPSPDIRAFVNRGGKLIQYHGWNDSVVRRMARSITSSL